MPAATSCTVSACTGSYPVPSEPACGKASPGVSKGSSRPLCWRKLLASFMAILMTHVVGLESPRKDGRKRRTLKNVDWKTSSASNRLPIRETRYVSVSYTHLRAHETRHDLVCRLLLEKKKNKRDNRPFLKTKDTTKQYKTKKKKKN